MNVLLLSPGYPADMPEFTRGLAEAGVRVYGVGDSHPHSMQQTVRRFLDEYIHVPSLWDEEAVIEALRERLRGQSLDRIECLWEPAIILAARLREAFGVEGLTVDQVTPFRDKELMKQVLDKAGIRTPRHVAAASIAGVWEAADDIGFPVIIKPIAGAGSADTYRIGDGDELRAVLPRLRHVPAVSVEEFVEGEEFTFDAITVGGRIAYYNIAWYRPRPLISRSNEWISPQVIALKNIDQPDLQGGVKMGYDVIGALGFDTGFTHMEWYRKSDGEVVFGEIGARPPGAHQVDQMKYLCDFDVFREWANAVTQGKVSGGIEPKYNVANIYKRARGVGRITGIEGADKLHQEIGEHVVWDSLLPVGARRRDWRKTLVSDGFIMLRHPDLQTTLAMADRVGSELQLYAE